MTTASPGNAASTPPGATPKTSRRALTWFAAASLLTAPLFALLALRMLAPAELPLDVAGYAVGRDFANVWNGARLALSGEVLTLFDVSAYQASLETAFGGGFPDHNWSYPPHALALFAVFGTLPYLTALGLWLAVTTAAFLVAVALLVPAERRSVGLVLAASSPASLINAGFGQNGHLTAALMLGGISCLDRRPWLAGVLFGLLTIKPHLGLLVPFALAAIGAWRTIVSAGLTTAALVALSVALFGFEPWRLYLEVTTDVQSGILAHGGGLFVAMMPTVFQAAKTLLGAGFAVPAQVMTALVAAPLAILAFRRAPDPATRALVLTSGTLLALPYAFNYDMVMLAGATVAWLMTRDADGRVAGWLLPAWVAPVAIVPLGLVGLPLGPVALIAVFAAAVSIALSARAMGSRAAVA